MKDMSHGQRIGQCTVSLAFASGHDLRNVVCNVFRYHFEFVRCFRLFLLVASAAALVHMLINVPIYES